MCSNVKYGWATVKLGDFIGRCSYLDDPIFDIGNILLNGSGVTTFDAEGYFFDFILTDRFNDIYIVAHYDKKELFDTDISITDFVKEIIDDINNNLNAWVYWFSYSEEDESYYTNRKNELVSLIDRLQDKYLD